MTNFRRPFGRDELPADGEPQHDVARALAAGRELEALASRASVSPGEDFAERVMSALAAEPLPRPAAAAGLAVRQRRLAALVLSIRDAWRVAFSGGRPLMVRAQALALVAVVVVALGSLGGAAAIEALGALSDGTTPPATVPVVTTPSPTPEPRGPSPSPSPPPTSEPTEPAQPTDTVDPTDGEAAEPTDDETAGPTGTRTPRPTGDDEHTAGPSHTPEPAETPHGTGED
jgi:hypothetical protein